MLARAARGASRVKRYTLVVSCRGREMAPRLCLSTPGGLGRLFHGSRGLSGSSTEEKRKIWFDHQSETMSKVRRISLGRGRWTFEFTLAELTCHAAFVLLGISYMASSVMVLRVMAVFGLGLTVAFQFFRPQPLWLPIRWNLVFIAINIVMITLLLLQEGRGHLLDEEEEGVYRQVFQVTGIGRADFVRILKKGVWRSLPAGSTLIEQGGPSNRLHLIVAGRAMAFRDGYPLGDLNAGDFAGEMAFIRGYGEASASVVAMSDVRELVWHFTDLNEFFDGNPKSASKIRSLLGNNLVKKVESLRTSGTLGESYRHLLQGVLVDNEVSGPERRAIDKYRREKHITDDVHKRALHDLGWTEEEYEKGKKEVVQDDEAENGQEGVGEKTDSE